MKNLFLSLLLLIPFTLFAQDANFDGTWFGYIYDDDDEAVNYLLVEIEGDQVTQYSYDSENDTYNEYNFDVQEFHVHRNNALYFWMNMGGVWSETQSYHLSLLAPGKAKMLYTRQVNNIREEGENEAWETLGTGTLTKVGGENYYNDPYVQARSNETMTISFVERAEEHTKVGITWKNDTESTLIGTFYGPGTEYAMYLTPQDRSIRYPVTDIDGTSFGMENELDPGESLEVTLYFEPIGDLEVFDLIEPGEIGTTWNFFGVVLKQ